MPLLSPAARTALIDSKYYCPNRRRSSFRQKPSIQSVCSYPLSYGAVKLYTAMTPHPLLKTRHFIILCITHRLVNNMAPYVITKKASNECLLITCPSSRSHPSLKAELRNPMTRQRNLNARTGEKKKKKIKKCSKDFPCTFGEEQRVHIKSVAELKNERPVSKGHIK